ncbi:hypothetical protein [Clostridium sp. D33t1_170424_F3]|uniref:TadE/TadG family type IV pilus assembly protein n=1 Tax=Clostridium sp. D33t1_170424_F3 TaxID=2787099 RepID=UPI0018ABF0DE|nr:hypothetical protein [Clostridium sp. D33t1_170424_F3]
MKEDEKGYIVVETATAFMLLVLLMVSILSLVNIVTVQSRIHYALTQAAETVSLYSYTLEVTGMAESIKNNAEKAEQVNSGQISKNINELLDGLKSLSENQTAGKNTAVQVKDWVENAAQSPKQTIQLMLNYGLKEMGDAAFSALIRPLVGRYLDNGSQSGDDYLKAFHVSGGLKGLEFYSFDPSAVLKNPDGGAGLQAGARHSTLMDSNGDVWLTVNYEIDYTFGALPLPFEPKLKISQTVKTKAWLGGDGEGYQR